MFSDEDPINSTIPSEVTELGLSPDVALLTTLYIFNMGHKVGQEMAATAGFPVFPKEDAKRRDLMSGLERNGLHSEWALARIKSLERNVSAAPSASAGEILGADERLLAAAMLNQDARTEEQLKKLTSTLWDISRKATAREGREDMEYWTPGITAIGKLTRLMIEAVIPTRIGTMTNLFNTASGLRQISTLGGALFLGHSIGILTGENAADPQSPYAVLGGRIAGLTQGMGGQPVNVPPADKVEQYTSGLQAFAARGDSVFAIEHPFHFRVLLEVLSDENRRYPAEPVLNVAALRSILPDRFFRARILWSRQQLPVVENFLRSPEETRADAYIQHYAAFGRTPHTSSFTHLNYEVRSLVGDDSVGDTWPEEFQDYRSRLLRNMPNSVCQVLTTLDRERCVGRLWRGAPEDTDLRWLCGQLVEWDGLPETDEELVNRIWHSDHWSGQTFPVDAMAEIRVGAWLLEALRRRLEAVPPTARGDGRPNPDRERIDREYRATEELRCVLEIMMLFSADYLAGDNDGLLCLKQTLGRLRDSGWFIELGSKMSAKLHELEASLDASGLRLEAEVRLAREAVSGGQA